SDVQAAAKKYYKPSNRTVGLFIPEAAPDRTVVAETPDIEKLLTGYQGKEGAAQKAAFENSIGNIKKNLVMGKLPNGGQYVLLEKPTKGEKIAASIALRMGDENNLMNKAEIATITAAMLKTGTTSRTKKQISDELDRLKTDISFNDAPGGLLVRINTDQQNLAAALSLLDDLLHHPKFDSAEFEKVVMDTKANYEANKSEPFNVAQNKLSKMASHYPVGHPLYQPGIDERLAALGSVKLEDVRKFYGEFYGANNSISSFVGELDKKQVTDFLETSFGKWNSKASFALLEPKYFEVKSEVATINTPDKTNAAALGVINLKISQRHPDYPAVFMANELLGGGAFLSSRIPQRLRENEGMSYGAGTFMNAQYKYDVANWGLYAAYNPSYRGRIDTALRQEIDKAIKGGFTKDELEKSVGSLLEQNKTSLGSNEFLANLLRSYLRDERDLADFLQFENKVKALTPNAVNAALRKYFDPSKLVIIYAGDFAKQAF
ncbi:MAG TPA: pitrilysin family protein, partial [Flavisolibacter sp.]|nr:pitrilysin family protein [Flavisolibacter sp.]